MQSETNIVENLWTSILQTQKILKQVLLKAEDKEKNVNEQELITCSGDIYNKIGRLLVKTTLSDLKRQNAREEEEKLKVQETKDRLSERLEFLQIELNDFMESDPLYCLKRVIARTINLNQRLSISESGARYWQVFNISTPCSLQQGPTCGMVSLLTAAKTRGAEALTVEDVLSVGRGHGFTRRGEMFSAAWLSVMTRELVPGSEVRLESAELILDTEWLLTWVTSGGLILIPYDCAANSSVCLENGHKAHWGLITGLVLPTDHPPPDTVQSFENYSIHDNDNKSLMFDSLNKNDRGASVKVVVRQSKSLELEFYNRDRLVASCDNLREVADKRLDGSYVIPADGIEATLKNKIITIR